MEKKNLSKEYREIMAEAKVMVLTSAMKDSVCDMDAGEVMTTAKALILVNRLIDLCGDVFEKQDRLMDKLDKFMDRCLVEEED